MEPVSYTHLDVYKRQPDQLMRVVLCYCGIDQVLRETAGNFTLLEERISDTAIHRRLKAVSYTHLDVYKRQRLWRSIA